MKISGLAALILGAAAFVGAAGQERAREEKPAEDACQSALQRHRTAEEASRKAKEEGAPPKTMDRRSKELERARREYCECLARSGKAGKAAPEESEKICGLRAVLPVTSADTGTGITAPAPPPTPAPNGTACGEDAAAYEKTWMRYSENTKNKALQRQLQSSKVKLCDCLTKNYGYEGVLPQRLRAFCEDKEILTPPYFPSRGETPTAAP